MDCFDENTYTLKETIFETHIADQKITNDTKYWKSNRGAWGQCHTFQFENPLKSVQLLEFGITPNASSYGLVLHDPKFYMINLNPSVFPRIFKHLKVEYRIDYRIDCRL